jgi:hypothetical protein
MSYSDEEYESVCETLKLTEARLAEVLALMDLVTARLNENTKLMNMAVRELERLRGEPSTEEARVHTD